MKLPLPDLLRQLDPLIVTTATEKLFEARHRSNPMLDPSVVLFDFVVQLLARPRAHALGQFAIFFNSTTARCDAA